MNPDAVVITAIIMVFAILLGGMIFVWWLDRKDRLEDCCEYCGQDMSGSGFCPHCITDRPDAMYGDFEWQKED